MTTETLWIIVAVVVAVLLIAVALGLVLRRQRRISLREPEKIEREPGAAPPPRKGGSYKAESGFSFSTGAGAPPKPVDRPAPPPDAPPTTPPIAPPTTAPPAVPPAPPRPAAPSETPRAPRPAPQSAAPPAAPPRAAPTAPEATAPPLTPPVTPPVTPPAAAPGTTAPRTAPEVAPSGSTARPVTGPETTGPGTTAPETVAPGTTGAAAPPADRASATTDDVAAAPGTAVPGTATSGTAVPGTPVADAAAPGTVALEQPAPEQPAPQPPAPDRVAPDRAGQAAPTLPTTPYPPGSSRADGARSTNGAAPPLAPPAPPVAMPPAPPGPAPAAPVERAVEEPIDPAEGRLDRLRGRLARSRSGFGQGLLGLLGAGELDEESWEDVEAMLLQADLGPEMTVELVETLRVELARRAVRTSAQARQLLRDVLTAALRPELDRSVRALPHDGRPAVLLIVGVNGTGKTTTTGKLARVLVAGGRHVVLGAADTFRAAAAEQLGTWGQRAGATVVRGPEGADPASVAFDAVRQGTDEGADAVLLDTAGRLHTKTGLMDELGKVKRVVSRQAEVDEVLLVLDATTGQNGLTQARVFGDVVDVSGIVLTKLDGTAKGGIVFRVQRELGVPVKLVGLGEGPDDLAPFEPAAFVDALLT